MRGGVAVQGDHPWDAMLPRRPGKESLGGRDVPPSAQEKIDGAARFYPRRDRGRPSGLDAPLGHHLDQVRGAEFEGEIQSYAEHDDFPVKAPALKELLCRGGFRHRWPLAPQGQLFKFAPDPTALCLTEVFGPIWRAGDSGG